MRYKVFASFLFLFLTLGTFAQSINRDSLKTALAIATTDSIKIQILEELAITGEYGDRTEAISYYERLLTFDIETRRRGEVLNRIGFFNWQLGNLNDAIIQYKHALTIFEELNDSAFIGRIYNNIATSNWGLGENIEALKNYQTSLHYRKAVGDTKGVSRVLNNIGKLYQDLGLFDEALLMHSEALEYAQSVNDAATIAYSYANIGNCHEHFEELEKALDNYKTGYKILTSAFSENRSNSYFSSFIGGVFLKLNQPDSALFYNRTGLEYAHGINNKRRIAIAEYSLGLNYLDIGQTDSAQLYLNSSYLTSSEKGYAVILKDNLFALANLAEKVGNINVAFNYYKRASLLNDSLYNDDVLSKVADLQIKYANEQQEQENLLLRKNNEIQEITIRQQKTLTWYLAFSVLLILIVLFFITKSHTSIKKLNRKLEKSEKDLMQANANKDKFFTIVAHDLKTPFNGLLGITQLLESDYDHMSKKEIKELIVLLRKSSTNVYSLIEGLLQWAQTQIGSMEYDFKTFDFYFNCMNICDTLGQVATSKQISLVNKVKPNTFVYADEKSTLTVIRNLVSNAIKFTHAGGTIEISAKEDETKLFVMVKDNGLGMSRDKINKLFRINEKVTQKGTNDEIGTGLGLIICREFIEKNKGEIWVESEIGQGSTFRFSLPK